MKKHALFPLFFLAFILSQIDAGSWSSPVTLEGTWSVNPSIATDSKGTSVAVWLHFDDDALVWVHAATKRVGKSWSSPVTLSGPFERTDIPREQPVVLFDQKDNAFAIWPESVGIQGAILPRGKDAWTFVQTPFSTEHSYDNSVHVAFDSPGSALIVCQILQDKASVIESARVQLSTMTWTPLPPITVPYDAYQLSMAMDGSGNARHMVIARGEKGLLQNGVV